MGGTARTPRAWEPPRFSGIDGSERMIVKARAINAGERITYEVCDIEEYAYPERHMM
ncbi:class I SAM-dependent methyltransferase [Bifidobacterium samirii]|uniref:class I SAM-dependent methyltransferase n=1 Tax=Bifidobacterium samirii TaxID=2306974 RepID=UPI001F49B559|nr:class I SAM-dependent methyltransferase [Bifidobacterium samirii]